MRTAVIFGSSGLVGHHILNLLLQDDYYSKIKIFLRSPISLNHKKLEIVINDFNNITSLEKDIFGDHCFFCIGTTKKQTPNSKEYRRIEYDLPIKIGAIAKKNNINTFLYISSLGSNPNTKNVYLSNKGQTEEKLKNLNFDKLAIIKPSMMLGERGKFRFGEFLGQKIFITLSVLFIGPLKKFKAINSKQVAKAMTIIAKGGNSRMTYESDILQNF